MRVEVEGVDECEASIWALRKGHGDRAVEVDDGRRGHLAEVGVEGGDAGKVGVGGDCDRPYSPGLRLFCTFMPPVGRVSSTKRSVALTKSESLA